MSKKITIALSIVIVLLILFILGMLIVKPAIQNKNEEMVNAGIQYAIVTLMQQAATCDVVPLTFENQTINIIAVECLQQQAEVQGNEE